MNQSRIRNLALVFLITFSSFAGMCDNGGLLSGFRAGVAASRPFVQSLVASGVINQGKADTVVRDLNDGINAALRGEQCIKIVTGTGNDKKIAQAKCYFAVAKDLRAILARHNIGGGDQLNKIASIVEGAIAAFEEYFRSVTEEPTAARGAQAPEDPDKALERKMRDAEAQLKALTK